MTTADLKSVQESVMTIALLYKANITSAEGRTVNFRFPSGDDKLNFQHHLQEIRVPSVKLIKGDHGLSLGVQFIK